MREKRTVIFGATSAIAMETARLWAVDGAELCLVARDESRLEQVAKDLLSRGASQAVTLSCDFSDEPQCLEIGGQILEKFGEYDRVLLAYGYLGDQRVSEREFERASEIIKLNFTSVVALLTGIANYFEGRGKGQIAVICSVAGDRGRKSNYIYGASKGGLAIFLQGLRNRLFGSGVQVLTIKPGFVDTPMTAHIENKGVLFVGPKKIAQGIVRALRREKEVVYLPWFWWLIMAVIKAIPEKVFKRLSI